MAYIENYQGSRKRKKKKKTPVHLLLIRRQGNQTNGILETAHQIIID